MWMERRGTPESLHCEKKNAFVLTMKPTDAEVSAWQGARQAGEKIWGVDRAC
jgi:hypothetical protein